MWENCWQKHFYSCKKKKTPHLQNDSVRQAHPIPLSQSIRERSKKTIDFFQYELWICCLIIRSSCDVDTFSRSRICRVSSSLFFLSSCKHDSGYFRHVKYWTLNCRKISPGLFPVCPVEGCTVGSDSSSWLTGTQWNPICWVASAGQSFLRVMHSEILFCSL